MRFHVTNPATNMLCGQPVTDGWVELDLVEYMQPLVEAKEIVSETQYLAEQAAKPQMQYVSSEQSAPSGAEPAGDSAEPAASDTPSKAKLKR